MGSVVTACQQQDAAAAAHTRGCDRLQHPGPGRSPRAAACCWQGPVQLPLGPLRRSWKPPCAVLPGVLGGACVWGGRGGSCCTPVYAAHHAMQVIAGTHSHNSCCQCQPLLYLTVLLQVLYQPAAVEGCGKVSGEAGESLFAGLSPLGHTTCQQSVAGVWVGGMQPLSPFGTCLLICVQPQPKLGACPCRRVGCTRG